MSTSLARLLAIDGHGARVVEAGPIGAPAVVVIASMVVLAPAYRPLLHRLSRHFRAYIVELPGSGGASKLRQPWDTDAYASWSAKLLSALGVPDITLIGHSNSGPVALSLAVSHPHLIRRLVLVDTIGFDMRFSLPRIIAARALDAVLEPGLTLRAGWQPPFNLLRHTRNFLNQIRTAARLDLRQRAAELDVPVLIGWGKRDHTMPLRCAQLLHEVVPRSRLYVCETGSHDWLITHPSQFACALLDYVNGHGAAKPDNANHD
jgi:pimeloyl-ACP methyl ester carboxylesterase